jgi:hypothetical protein
VVLHPSSRNLADVYAKATGFCLDLCCLCIRMSDSVELCLSQSRQACCCCCTCGQATLKGLEQQLHDAKVQHEAHMQQLHSQHEELEERATNMLQQAQQRLSATTVADSEVSAARDKATAAVEMEAAAAASGHR